MKVLIVSQYFYPENFRINDVALGLREKGHEVHVFTGKPNYPKGKFFDGYGFFSNSQEIWEGIKIIRTPEIPRGKGGGIRLFTNYLSFVVFGCIKALFLKGKYDAILVYEPSPITVGIPAILISKLKRVPLYFWVQDLWPESLEAAGQVSNKFVLKQIDKLTRWIYKHSKKVLIQSQGFRNYISDQGVQDDKIVYYPNSTEALYDRVALNPDVQKLLPKAPFMLLFAGNIGEAQDFDNIVLAAERVIYQFSEIHIVILGDGRKRKSVENMIKERGIQNNFHFLGSYPPEMMPQFFAFADGLLVSLKDERIFSLTIPSKVQSYMACYKPIIASLNGEAAHIIIEAQAGFTSNAGDPNGLAQAIINLYQLSAEERDLMGKNAGLYFNANFEREKLLNKLIEILKT